MFLVPFYALAASAGFLARHYQDIRAWRFPEDSFQAFRQCVLLARRRSAPVPDNPLDQRRIERWAADAGAMPELRESSQPVLRVCADRAGLELEQVSLDLKLRAYSPVSSRGTGLASRVSTGPSAT
jgi:hypothetical protein